MMKDGLFCDSVKGGKAKRGKKHVVRFLRTHIYIICLLGAYTLTSSLLQLLQVTSSDMVITMAIHCYELCKRTDSNLQQTEGQ